MVTHQSGHRWPSANFTRPPPPPLKPEATGRGGGLTFQISIAEEKCKRRKTDRSPCGPIPLSIYVVRGIDSDLQTRRLPVSKAFFFCIRRAAIKPGVDDSRSAIAIEPDRSSSERAHTLHIPGGGVRPNNGQSYQWLNTPPSGPIQTPPEATN